MLSRLGCASIKEFSLGPREGLLKEGLLQQLYLKVPHTNSSEYECSWSPQSNMEITKMKALVRGRASVRVNRARAIPV
ncbi:hypothetical protein ACRRTK_018654 [Alexandromys fortis]